MEYREEIHYTVKQLKEMNITPPPNLPDNAYILKSNVKQRINKPKMNKQKNFATTAVQVTFSFTGEFHIP